MFNISRCFILVSLLTISLASGACAASQSLSGNQRWLTVASTQDLDTAKGIASSYAWQGAKIMSAAGGWYAVVLGPYEATSMAALKEKVQDLPDLPADALLSRGDKYTGLVADIKRQEGDGPLAPYDMGKPAHFSLGNLSIDVMMEGEGDNAGPTSIVGTENGKTAFSFKTPADFDHMGANAGMVRLDPGSESPQLVVTRYSGGAHCCTATWIVTKPKGAVAWSMVEAGTVDGGGYGFEDLDSDGNLEITGVDNHFLYSFDSYAGSMAPQKIYQLRGTSLKDVTNEPAFLAQSRQDLAAMEFNTKLGNDLWHANGFLAAWVAKKIQLGEGDAAWAKMMKSYDKNSEFGPQVCTTGQDIGDCPAENLQAVPFPKALAQFLRDNDFGSLPQAAQQELQ